MAGLTHLKIKGFKSIKELDLEIKPINVLIGANGAGKSNLVSFFRMIDHIQSERLQRFIGLQGGANTILHYGAKTTAEIVADLEFDGEEAPYSYQFELTAAPPDQLAFTNEKYIQGHFESNFSYPGNFSPEAHASLNIESDTLAKEIITLLQNCRAYQFHDTTDRAEIRTNIYRGDHRYLRDDGGNLPAYLLLLHEKHPEYYRRIISVIKLCAPFFKDFKFVFMGANDVNVGLNWIDASRDYVFGAHQLSDGTLRFIALTTLLMQPESMLPSTIIIDEPELGLHPYAISLLASMIRKASHYSNIILATQSIRLLNEFEPEDVIVVDREDGASTFNRLDLDDLKEWLEEYDMGELWEKNVLGGRPSR